MPVQIEKTIYAKTTSAKLYIYIGVGARDLYIDEAHTAVDIFRIWHLFGLYSVSLGDALTTAAVQPFFIRTRKIQLRLRFLAFMHFQCS